MALWKKLLIWAAVLILAFIIVVVIVVVTAYNTPVPQVPVGRYNLTKITEYGGNEEILIEEFDDGSHYIEIKDKNILESHSEGYGIEPVEQQFYYYLSGSEMPIYQMEDETFAYAAVYKNGIIRVFIKTDNITRYYYYTYQSK